MRRAVLASIGLVAIAIGTVGGCSSTSFWPRQQASPTSSTVPAADQWMYDFLLFEIAPVSSATPDPKALDYVKERLNEHRICKSKNVVFIIHQEEALVPPIWNRGFLDHYEVSHRIVYDPDPKDRIGLIFVSYLDGPIIHQGQLKYLGGLQYSQSAFVVFMDSIRRVEGAVFLHELGHLIGVRKKSLSPKHHCAKRKCVMYPSVGSAYANFCDECSAEIQALTAIRNQQPKLSALIEAIP